MISSTQPLPLPSHFNSSKVGEVWRVPYQQRATEAQTWTIQHNIQPAATDQLRVCLLLIDVQNTFCIPEFELFVGGRSGQAAVEDNVKLCEFIYHNLGGISQITATLDTHLPCKFFTRFFG